ncbi:hypothetical protein [Ensifer aridi]|uniref:hypothetical protein n=1 Tax=Ensifer aridi TaxID=1708715 RepID=UPI000A0F715D|nr:hypothetical protein [Ensifer aridi]
MRYWEAVEASVTAADAIAECKRHSVDVVMRENDRAIIEVETGEVVADADEHGEYAGSDILSFLGY